MKMVTRWRLPTPVLGRAVQCPRSGVVDAAENNAPSFRTSRHYEARPYYCLTSTRLPDVLVISTRVWNKLSPEQQRVLQRRTTSPLRTSGNIWAEAELKDLQTVQSSWQIVRPTRTVS
jgi:TRAP-type C4-dicarboxylate transport system substrate-binding protein